MLLAEKQLLESQELKLSEKYSELKVKRAGAEGWGSAYFLRDGDHGTKLGEVGLIPLRCTGCKLTKANNISEASSSGGMRSK